MSFSYVSLPLSYPPHTTIHSLGVSWLFREHPEHKVSVLLGLEGGGDDDILSLGQAEAGADLSQVDEGLRAGLLGMGQEIVLIQVDLPLAVELFWHLGLESKETQADVIRITYE